MDSKSVSLLLELFGDVDDNLEAESLARRLANHVTRLDPHIRNPPPPPAQIPSKGDLSLCYLVLDGYKIDTVHMTREVLWALVFCGLKASFAGAYTPRDGCNK